MAKKPISHKKADRQQQENLALQRVLNVFLLGLAAECYLFIVYRGYIVGSVSSLFVWDTILHIGAWLGLVMLLGGAAGAVWKRENAKVRRILCRVAGVGLFLALTGWIMISLFDKGVTIMCIAVPILTLLGLVYFLFQHECFLTTIVLAGGLFAVWVCGNGLNGIWRTYVIVGAVLSLVVLAAAAFLVRKVQRNGGKWKDLRVFSQSSDYRVLYAALAVSAAAVLIALIAPSFSYYLLWTLGILLFAEMVYYTTKLM